MCKRLIQLKSVAICSGPTSLGRIVCLATICLLSQGLLAQTNPLLGKPGRPVFVEPTTWGQETNGFKLALIPSGTNFVVGEAIRVQVTLRNAGSVVRDISQTSGWDFDFTVRDQQGRLVPLTEYGRKVKNERVAMWNNNLRLKPGDEVNDEARLDRVWDMSHAGKYLVTAERGTLLPNAQKLREQGREEWKTRIAVVSNTIEINVSEPPRKRQP